MTIDVQVEMYWDGAWQDITDDVDLRSDIKIDYGESDEHGSANPTDCKLLLDNADSKYSPLDPNSALYGKIGQGTPLRVRIGSKAALLALPGQDGSYASTPDHSSLDITGDHDFRLGLHPRAWRATSEQSARGLARKYDISDDQRSWAIGLRDDGTIRLLWSPDGTLASRIAVTSTAAIPADTDDIAIRITLDVDNGASGNDVAFYTADKVSDLGGGPSEAQLGATVTTAGTTSVHAGTADVELGRVRPNGIAWSHFDGTLDAFELRDGIGGTVVTDPDFTVPEPEDETLTDDAGREWTIHGGAAITDPSLRASTSVAAWQPAWDETALDAQMAVTAAGILRRLGQGDDALGSSLFRDLSTRDEVVAYWPMEDGENATRFASVFDGGDTLTPYGDGEIHPAAYSGFAASEPIPEWTDGQVQGSAGDYEGADQQRIMMLLHVPEDGVPDDRRIFLVRTKSSSLYQWWVYLNSSGGLRLRIEDDSGGTAVDSTFGFDLNGDHALLTLLLEQNGSNVDWGLATFGLTGGAGGVSGSEPGVYERMTRIAVGAAKGLNGCAIGHVTVINDDTDTIWDLSDRSLAAWSGETATARILRLCTEEDVPLQMIGTAELAQDVGPQLPEEFLNLIEEPADADLGRFGERRDAPGLLYRSREDLYGQDPALTLDMDDGAVTTPFDPPLDDQDLRNDVTVTRQQGSSARAAQLTGPLSIQAVGRYPATPTLNVADDDQLANQARWRLHLGTVDEHRIASLTIEMEHHPDLEQAVLGMRVGDLVRITNPPPGLPPGPLDLLALGWTDVIGDNGQTWHVTINCAPASPWTVAVMDGETVDGQPFKLAAAGSQLAANATAAATTLKVLTTLGPLWTEDASEFPFDCTLGGEVVTVSDIAPAVLDEFTRSETNGWGAADSGQGWSLAGGAASDYSVDGARGLVSLDSVGVSRRTILPESLRDVDVVASVATDAVATGAWITGGLAVRRPDSSNYYMARVEFRDDGNVALDIYKTVSGTETSLTSGHVLGSYSADERFWVRFSVVGSRLRAKIWRVVGESEPDWQLDVTDTDLTATANIATHNELLSGNTNSLPVILSWDDLDSQNQLCTVTRSANGISKSQTAGTGWSLATRPVMAL